jgi:hypothetical protein
VVHDVSSFPQDEENVGVGPVEEQLHAGTQYHACYTSYLKKSCLLQFLIFRKKERDLDNKNILLHANIVWEEHKFHTFDLNMDGYEEKQNLIATFM